MTQPLCTFIIPCAPYHADVLQAAVASVEAQTLPAIALPMKDDSGTPARPRNRGVMMSDTPFVSFLDADDTLEPDFLEKMLSHWQPGKYVYSDWYQDTVVMKAAPKVCILDTTSHLVNTLMTRDMFEYIGGFDTTIPLEDSEFILRALSKGVCGIHCPYPLVHYRGFGVRSQAFDKVPNKGIIQHNIMVQYVGRIDMCCGGTDAPNGGLNLMLTGDPPPEGFVKARVLPQVNKQHIGVMTGNVYPNAGYGQVIYAHADDVANMPGIFEAVGNVQDTSVLDVNGMVALARAGLRNG